MRALGLDGHFEGGYFRETFKATHRDAVDTARGKRTTMTVIYSMLTDDSPIDAFHTKCSDGVQFYHLGAPITYHLILERFTPQSGGQARQSASVATARRARLASVTPQPKVGRASAGRVSQHVT